MTCHICGLIAQRKSMMVRKDQWVCRNIPACTERVFNPPQEFGPRTGPRKPPVVHIPIVPDVSGISDALAEAAKSFEAFNEAAAALNGFQPIGYLSETGIER